MDYDRRKTAASSLDEQIKDLRTDFLKSALEGLHKHLGPNLVGKPKIRSIGGSTFTYDVTRRGVARPGHTEEVSPGVHVEEYPLSFGIENRRQHETIWWQMGHIASSWVTLDGMTVPEAAKAIAASLRHNQVY